MNKNYGKPQQPQQKQYQHFCQSDSNGKRRDEIPEGSRFW